MRNMILLILCCFLASCTSFVEAQVVDDYIFELTPADGSLFGRAGEAVGWGYKVTNLSTSKWLLGGSIISVSPFLHGTTTNLFRYPAVAPNTTVEVPYERDQGIVKLHWDADAPTGYVNSGNFEFDGYWYDGDPYDPIKSGALLSSAGIQKKPYTATVIAGSTVPEPSSITLFAIGGILSGSWLFLRRRKRCKP